MSNEAANSFFDDSADVVANESRVDDNSPITIEIQMHWKKVTDSERIRAIKLHAESQALEQTQVDALEAAENDVYEIDVDDVIQQIQNFYVTEGNKLFQSVVGQGEIEHLVNDNTEKLESLVNDFFDSIRFTSDKGYTTSLDLVSHQYDNNDVTKDINKDTIKDSGYLIFRAVSGADLERAGFDPASGESSIIKFTPKGP